MTTSRTSVKISEPWSDPTAAPFIRLENLTKTFGGEVAVNNVSI